MRTSRRNRLHKWAWFCPNCKNNTEQEKTGRGFHLCAACGLTFSKYESEECERRYNEETRGGFFHTWQLPKFRKKLNLLEKVTTPTGQKIIAELKETRIDYCPNCRCGHCLERIDLIREIHKQN